MEFDSNFSDEESSNKSLIKTEIKKEDMNFDTKEKHISNHLQLKFNTLTKFFQKILTLKGRQKEQLLIYFFDEYLFKITRKNSFETLRLILPEQDRERANYGLKEKNLAKVISDTLNLPANESKKLKFFKNPNYQNEGMPVGDFASTVFITTKNFFGKESLLSVGDLNGYLDKLCLCENHNEKVSIFTGIIRKSTAEDFKWICKIILKDLKIGLKHERVLKIYHPEALELFNLTSNLREVCQEFENKNSTLKTTARLFLPIKPMLAGRKTLEIIKGIFHKKNFLIETKYDGERIQCHFNNEKLLLFSRNAINVSHIYCGKLERDIRKAVLAQSAILDGEVIVVEKLTGKKVEFGMNKPVALQDIDNEYQLKYMIFDILYVKGTNGEECLTLNIPLSDRKKILTRVIKNTEKVQFVEGKNSSDYNEIANSFEECMNEGQEGLIIKQLNSIYSPNERGSNWVKLKADYIEGLADSLDLIVLGGYFGKRAVRNDNKQDWTEHITHFLLGIAKKVDLERPENSVFLPFCKVGTGYSDTELIAFLKRTQKSWVKFEPKFHSKLLSGWVYSSTDKPDAIISNFTNTYLFEIRAAEIVKTETFLAGYTLRFPRVVKIRYDKSWNECMSINELEDLIENKENRKEINYKEIEGMNKRSESLESIENFEEKKARKKKKKTGKEKNEKENLLAGKNEVLEKFKDTNTSNVIVQSNLFENCEFYIINVNEQQITKSYLETILVKYGGKKVQNHLYTNTHIIAEYLNFTAKALLQKHAFNILKPKWILDCIKKNVLLDFSPKYLLFAQPWIIQKNKYKFDCYGDSYFEMHDKESLEEMIEDIEYDKNIFFENERLLYLKDKIKEKINYKKKPLEGKVFFIDTNEINYENKGYKIKIIIAGGTVVENLNDKIDYLIEDTFSKQNINQIQNYIKKFPYCKIISSGKLTKIINEASTPNKYLLK